MIMLSLYGMHIVPLIHFRQLAFCKLSENVPNLHFANFLFFLELWRSSWSKGCQLIANKIHQETTEKTSKPPKTI